MQDASGARGDAGVGRQGGERTARIERALRGPVGMADRDGALGADEAGREAERRDAVGRQFLGAGAGEAIRGGLGEVVEDVAQIGAIRIEGHEGQ